jgi:subtilisin family serine protease
MRRLTIIAALLAAAWNASAAANPSKRLIVGFKPGMSVQARDAKLRKFGLNPVESIAALGLEVAESPAGRFQPSAVRMMADPDVYYVEEDFYTIWLVNRAPAAPVLPSVTSVLADLPKFEQKNASQGEMPWGVTRVNAQKAWSRTKGRGVRVAVIDTGVDCAHPDLAANCVKGYNAFDKKKPPMDDQGHGTHVAGTIGAVADGKGVVGVAPEVKIVPVKVLDKNGGGRLTTILKGLIWVGNNDIDVANMSLGSPMGTVFMRLAVAYAKARGATVIAAAGNSGKSVGYPAAYGNTIAVSASDSQDSIAKFSSRGKEVDFIAPGVDVKSTLPGGRYGRYSGTSMATPHVSGLAALAVAQGAKGFDAVKSALSRGAAPMAGLSDKEQGKGMIDAARIRAK